MTAKPTGRRKGPIIWGALIGMLLIAGFVWFVHTMMQGKVKKSDRQVQVVQIIKPPPPPPPDQPPPPPPEKTEEPLPKDEPEPAPAEDAAPQEQLGLDAEGAAGGDAFGLAARKGGSDLVGGSGTAVFAWYTNRVRDTIQECLGRDGSLGAKKFSVSLNVLFGPDGKFDTKLSTSTGDRALDQKIETTLSSCSNMTDAPPIEMPRQVNIKIVSRL